MAAELHPKQLKSLYSAPVIIPSTHVEVDPRRRRMGRKEGKEDKRGGGRGKKGKERIPMAYDRNSYDLVSRRNSVRFSVGASDSALLLTLCALQITILL